MGILGIPTRGKGKQSNAYGKQYKSNYYTNMDAVEKLIRYVTRTREDETRAESLITYGSAGASYFNTVEDIIQQFQYIQEVYGIKRRGGRRMYHEVFNLLDYEAEWVNYAPELFWHLGMDCCRIYFDMGFQTVFAVHWEEGKHYHIHFAVNSISFMDGRKWHTSLADIKHREFIFNCILYQYQTEAYKEWFPEAYLNDRHEVMSPIVYLDRQNEITSPLIFFQKHICQQNADKRQLP